jgi:ABC-2 type transport system ATP-binding protein
VQLAAALVHEPDVLILDEPFSGLDPVGVDALSAILRSQADQRGVPVVFSSHQLELVERLCDGVVLIDHGAVVAEGAIQELRDSRSRRLIRIEITGAPERWWDVVPGVELVEPLAHQGGVFELATDADDQRLLDIARRAGQVRMFAPVHPTLAELFREVVRS